MKYKIGLLSLLLLLGTVLKAQEKSINSKGKVFARIYANFHRGINDNTSDISAFELLRGYIGYEYQFDEHYYAKINLDIGSPNDLSPYSKLRRYAYFKNAYLRYTNNNFNVEFGLIGLKYFKLQEKIWERRYIAKMFADEYKLISSADLGVNLRYNFNKAISTDFTITNGEGYNNIQTDDIFRYGVGATVKYPKGFASSIFYDFTKNDIYQSTFLVFTSYTYKNRWNIATEYIYRGNDDWQEYNNKNGFSFFGKYNINKKYQVFARYDVIESNILNDADKPWNLSKDGSAVIAGVQFVPIKHIKMALNYQDWYPRAKNRANDAFIYLNLEVKM